MLIHLPRRLTVVICAVLLSTIPMAPSVADTIISRWVGGATGNWSVPSNWDPPIVPNNGGGDIFHVVIDDTPGQDVIVTLNSAPINIETLTIDAGDALVMNAPATLILRGGLIDLDGVMQMNPQNSGLTRLFIATMDAQVIGTGEIQMLGQPGRCLIDIGSNLTLTLGDPSPLPNNETVLRGSGVVQGGTESQLKILERMLSDITGRDLILVDLGVEVVGVIEGIGGRLSTVRTITFGDGTIMSIDDIIGVRNSTFDGTNGLTIGPAEIEVFEDSTFTNATIEDSMVRTNNGATATFDGSIANVTNTVFCGDGEPISDDLLWNPNVTISGGVVAFKDSQVISPPGNGDRVIVNGDLAIQNSSWDCTTIEMSANACIDLTDVDLNNCTLQGDPNSENDTTKLHGMVVFNDVFASSVSLKLDPSGQPVEPVTWILNPTVITTSTIQGDPNTDLDQAIVQQDSSITTTSTFEMDWVIGRPGTDVNFIVEQTTIQGGEVFGATTQGSECLTFLGDNIEICGVSFANLGIVFDSDFITLEAFANFSNTIVLLRRTVVVQSNGFTTVSTDHVVFRSNDPVDMMVRPDISFDFFDGPNVLDVDAIFSGDVAVSGDASLDITLQMSWYTRKWFVAVSGDASLDITANVTANNVTGEPGTSLSGLQIGLAFANYVSGGALGLNESTAACVDMTLNDPNAVVAVDQTNQPGGGQPSVVNVSGDLSFVMTDETNWSWGQNSTLAMTGGVGSQVGQWQNWGRLEVGGTDLGTDPANHTGDPAGFDNNFDLSILEIGPGAHVYLQDLLDNGNRNGPFGASEALYVDTLVFSDVDAMLNLNGVHLYYGTLIGSPSQIIDVPVDPPADPATLTDVQIVKGTLLGGGLAELGTSDDLYLRVRSDFGVQQNGFLRMEMDARVTAETTVATPNLMDITVESRVDKPMGTLELQAFNWNSGQYELIDSKLVTDQDGVDLFTDIDATNYINSTGQIDIQLRHVVQVPQIAFNFQPSIGVTFESLIDQVQIDVR